ncbi:hypothetical protein [Telmatospirillum sp.]|uniref:hypothetical protein n=1 Tax=Telmatospirillum sp. TaxID=2079197 RepID=UPI003862E3B6
MAIMLVKPETTPQRMPEGSPGRNGAAATSPPLQKQAAQAENDRDQTNSKGDRGVGHSGREEIAEKDTAKG